MSRATRRAGDGRGATLTRLLPHQRLSAEERDAVRRLSAATTFACCSPGDVEALVHAGRVLSLPSGWTFLHEGTPADACYFLLEGEVRVRRGRSDLGGVGPGAVLGEMGLLGHSLRRASATTSSPVRALRVEYAQLDALLCSRGSLVDCVFAAYQQHVAADEGQERDAVRDESRSPQP